MQYGKQIRESVSKEIDGVEYTLIADKDQGLPLTFKVIAKRDGNRIGYCHVLPFNISVGGIFIDPDRSRNGTIRLIDSLFDGKLTEFKESLSNKKDEEMEFCSDSLVFLNDIGDEEK